MQQERGTDDAAPDGPRRDRPRGRRRGWLADRSTGVVAQALKERVYATFTGLALVLVLRGHETTPRDATFSLAIGVLGITVAGFAAEVIAHLGGIVILVQLLAHS